MSNDASVDYTKKVDRILTGNHIHKGAAGHTNTILRTQACHGLNGSTIEGFKARGIKHYRFMSLETVKFCNRCTSINDKVLKLQMPKKVLIYRQCRIVEYEEDEPMISRSEINDFPMNLQLFSRKNDKNAVKNAIKSGEIDEKLFQKRKEQFDAIFF